ncbi:MAG: glutathione S-transferase family protein [Burkholderiales bacterium]
MRLVIGNKNYSSWSLRPWLAMKHWAIPFEEIRIALYAADSHRQILQYSPSGKVPVLLDGQTAVWDSLAILEYLAERYPQLWPAEPGARAVARSVCAEMHSGFTALRQHLPMNCRARAAGRTDTPEVGHEIARVLSIWQQLREEYGLKGEFLFGRFTAADAMYAPVALRFVTYQVELPPLSQTYVQTLLGLAALREWLSAAEAETEVIPQYEP